MGNTKSEILNRLLAAIPSDLDVSEGSFIYDVLAAAAIEIAAAYTEAEDVLVLGFAETTSGTYLDYRAHEHGLTRKAATAASGMVTVTGSAGTVVPSDSLFATASGIQYRTTEAVTISSGGIVNATVEAVSAGTGGNVPAAALNTIPVSMPGVTSVTNPEPITGGTDKETDAALLTRLLTAVRDPATSGNAAHYKTWATSVDGIGAAKVLPLWSGAGTVKVVVIDTNMQPASADLVQDVAGYIETVRPIGAEVEVVSATGLSVDVSATITLSPSGVLSAVQNAFETALAAYFKEIAFQQDYVSYARIGSMLLDINGVSDYSDLLINGGTANIDIAETEVAIKGTVAL